ncbi:MAG: glycosyl hydrolase, partial [Bacteroidales bacterium]
MNTKKYVTVCFLISVFSLLLILVSCQPSGVGQENEIDRKVDSVLSLMTLEEKVGQLMQYTGFGEFTGPVSEDHNYLENLKKGMVGSMINVNGVEYTRTLQKIAVEETRLGIPLIFGYDVIHGYKTIFPIPLGETASWDLELIQTSASVAA